MKHRSGIPTSIVCLVALICLAGLPGAIQAGGETLTIDSRHENGRRREHMSWSGDGHTLEVWARGVVRFTPDYTDVVSISKGGSFKVRERRGLKIRSMEFEPGDDGQVERQFYVIGLKAHYDDEAREWLARVLPEAIDKTGLDAEIRARDALAQHGLDGLLRKAAELSGDHAKRIYYEVALEEGALDDAALARLTAAIGREVDSDHYKHTLLNRIVEDFDGVERAGDAVLAAVGTLSSDHYKAVVLLPLARNSEPTPAFFAAIGEIRSDHYRQQVLNRVVKAHDLTGDQLARAIETAADSTSDHYLSRFLLSVAGDVDHDARARDAFFEAVDDLDSDYYRQQVLDEVIEEGPVEAATYALILRATRGLGSDHSKAIILNRIAAEVPAGDDDLDRFLQTTATLGSDHYLNQVLEEFLRRDDLSEPVLKTTLSLVKDGISGQHYRGRLVEQISDRLIDAP